jgi:hypothetical protein
VWGNGTRQVKSSYICMLSSLMNDYQTRSTKHNARPRPRYHGQHQLRRNRSSSPRPPFMTLTPPGANQLVGMCRYCSRDRENRTEESLHPTIDSTSLAMHDNNLRDRTATATYQSIKHAVQRPRHYLFFSYDTAHRLHVDKFIVPTPSDCRQWLVGRRSVFWLAPDRR